MSDPIYGIEIIRVSGHKTTDAYQDKIMAQAFFNVMLPVVGDATRTSDPITSIRLVVTNPVWREYVEGEENNG